MPPAYLKTIKDELNYEYAKLISRSALEKKINYGFVTDRFKALSCGEITISYTIREWQKEQTSEPECVFCGSKESLGRDRLISK